MDDLTSKKAVCDGLMKYGFLAPDMTVHEFVEDELLSVPAVPLEPLAKWITENLSPRFGCDVCAKETENYERECCNCPMMNEQEVRDALTKWMEEQDAADRR